LNHLIRPNYHKLIGLGLANVIICKRIINLYIYRQRRPDQPCNSPKKSAFNQVSLDK